MTGQIRKEGPNPEDWEFWEGLMTSNLRSEEWRTAGAWALEVLKSQLGAGWLSRTVQDYGLPPAFVYGAAHAVAFAELLELALRLHLLERNPGMRHLRTSLRRDPRPGQIAHLRIQLEVAGLALRQGFNVRVEAQQEPRESPTDVLLEKADDAIAVECVAILASDEWRATNDFTDDVFHRVHLIEQQYRVYCSGVIGRMLMEHTTGIAFEELEYVAKQVAVDGKTRQVVSHGMQFVIAPQSSSMPKSLRGPVAMSDLWPKIVETLKTKATQTLGSRNVWIRLDSLQGLWQFTPWGVMPLEDKLPLISRYFREILTKETHISGVVLSSGALLAQGSFQDQLVETDSHVALRRVIAPLRVREVLILATGSEAQCEVATWRSLYSQEANWLDWALGLVNLPTSRAIFDGDE